MNSKPLIVIPQRYRRNRKMNLRDAKAKGTHTIHQWEALCAEFAYRCVNTAQRDSELQNCRRFFDPTENGRHLRRLQ